MSKTAFQSRISLDSGYATDGEMKVWECSTTFVDNEGVYTGYDITVGDVIAVDTSMYEPGTFTFYRVSTVVTPDAVTPVLEITYQEDNNNSWGAPDLNSMFGQPQTISRPSTNLGLLPVVSKDLQAVSDKYTEYVQNYNFVQIVDKMLSGNRVYTKVNGETGPLLKGMVVYINGSNSDQCLAASATTQPSSDVLGLVADVIIAPGMTGAISSSSKMEKPTSDWDIITGGTGGLIPGKDYFLRSDFPGGIHHVPPQDTGNFIVKIGKAVSSTILDINIDQPIEL